MDAIDLALRIGKENGSMKGTGFVITVAAFAAAIAGCGGGPIGAKPIHVAVTEYGFEPSQIVIPKNQDVTLVFTRTTGNTCATDLVFGPQQEKHDLPLNQDVRIWLPKGQPDTLYFACGMDMVKGMVIAK